MAVPANLSGEERAGRGCALPVHFPRHYRSQAAFRGRGQRLGYESFDAQVSDPLLTVFVPRKQVV